MMEVDPRKRPSIEEILMRPCCLTRLHLLYPQYIPTLFPYTTPAFPPSSGSSVSSGQQTTPSRRSKPQVKRLSVVAQPGAISPATSASSTQETSSQRNARSSPSIILQRVNGSGSGLTDDSSSLSTPRRASLPAHLAYEVKPIVRHVRAKEPKTLVQGQKALGNPSVARGVDRPEMPAGNVAALQPRVSVSRHAIPSSQCVISPLQPTIPSSQPPNHSMEDRQTREPTPFPSTRPIHQPPERHQPVIRPIRIVENHSETPHGRRNETGWRLPSKEEERRHKEGLQELRDMYLAMHRNK